MQRCGLRLQQLVVDRRVALVPSEAGAAAREGVLAVLASPDGALRAAVELCVVTSRTDELFDVVLNDMARWFGHQGDGSDAVAAGGGLVDDAGTEDEGMVMIGQFPKVVGWLLVSPVAEARSSGWSAVLVRTAEPPPVPAWHVPQRNGGVIELAGQRLRGPERRRPPAGGSGSMRGQ